MALPRVHGIELHEQPWCPASLRDTATDYLQFISNAAGAYNGIAPRLREALRTSGSEQVVDLCSGGGGPWLSLLGQFEADAPQILLTDRFPNRPALEHAMELSGGKIEFESESVNVMDVPARLRGFRTLFAAFHHFNPKQARAILADAVADNQPIAIFEGTERRVLQLISMLLIVPIIVLLAMPFVRPFRLSRIVWTYLVPVAPLLIAFDGFVSCLRTYTEDEMRELTRDLGSGSYEWEIGVERRGPVGTPYAIGLPPASRGH